MKDAGDRSTTQTNEAAPQVPLLEEDLAAYLFGPEANDDLGLEFEEEAAPYPAPPPRAPSEQLADATVEAPEAMTSQLGTPELSDDELAWALGSPAPMSLRSRSISSCHRNRRRAARHAVSTRAVVRTASADGDVISDCGETVQLRNLSTGGINALHARPLRRGDTFWITLRSPEALSTSLARTVRRRCMVLRCEAGGSGGALFSVAARFVAA
jgi:hypothetical protein